MNAYSPIALAYMYIYPVYVPYTHLIRTPLQYAAENDPTRASKQFSKLLKKNVPEPMARRLKAEDVRRLKELSKSTDGSHMVVKALPTKARGSPLLLGHDLDNAVKEYVESTRKNRRSGQ